MKTISTLVMTVIISFYSVTLLAQPDASSLEKVVYRSNPSSMISSSVTVPAGKKYFYSSGTLGPIIDSAAVAGSRERYGDTKTQAIGILEKFKADLAKEGLGLSNILFMRVYVAPPIQRLVRWISKVGLMLMLYISVRRKIKQNLQDLLLALRS
jgi:enamine deaminase RidA (YjgF/YER057c/UK114 family)